jgi:hypothetical protein
MAFNVMMMMKARQREPKAREKERPEDMFKDEGE